MAKGHNHPQRRNKTGKAVGRFVRHHPVLAVLAALVLVLMFPLLMAVLVDRVLMPALTPLLLVLFFVAMYRWVIRGRGQSPH
jgi:ABC-type bacteriocin/lantibiotic exporter with double-glycine peptidase domain